MRTIFPRGPEGRGDAALIAAARTGDPEAYAELSDRHGDAARRLARQLVAPERVDDLVSEALAKVLVVLQRGDGPDLAFRPYLLTAVRRLHVDHDPVASPTLEALSDPTAARAFTSLPEPWRMVLWHTEVEAQEPDDVAHLLAEPPESMPALISRAREGMRIALLTTHSPAVDKECEWTRQHLGAFVRKVSFDRDTARIERHLEGCESCAEICLELLEGDSDLRGVLAPLVLGSTSAGYLATTETSTRRARVAGRRSRIRVGAGVAVAVAAVTGSFGRVAAGATEGVSDRWAMVRDFATERTAATAVAGVATVAVLGGGAFIAVQTADGPLQAGAEAPIQFAPDDATTAPITPSPDDSDASGVGLPASSAAAEPSDAASTTGSASATPVSNPSTTTTSVPSSTPTRPGIPRPSTTPSTPGPGPVRPTQQPTQQPTRPPSQQPTQTPTQQPTQAPTPPTDMSISASARSFVGLAWTIDVYITGLAPGQTATLTASASSGSMTMDRRCRSDGVCSVTQTPSTYRFSANQSALGATKTLYFTVTPDGVTDADTSNNSTSVRLR